jgi:ubiquinone/menaquinone biosynthesis C-methylase UbiE
MRAFIVHGLGLLSILLSSVPVVSAQQEHEHQKHGHSSHSSQEPAAHEHDDSARATHRFEDAEKWSSIWDHPSRNDWQQPERIVELLDLAEGMSVADIGAGTGYFNPHLSKAVGPAGKVYAVDVEESLVEHMRERAASEDTPNVVPVLGEYDDPKIPVESVDRILMVDVYHHIDERMAYFRNLRRWLRPGDLFVNVDWKPGPMELGPSEHHKIAPETVEQELGQAGYELVAQELLKYHYVQVFRAVEGDPKSPER